MTDIIGTCSICGGPVVMPSMMVNAVPSCQQCGSRPKRPHGRVIEMEPIKTRFGDITKILEEEV